jgi:ribosomal protein S20
MPNTKSAEKALRQNKTAHKRNLHRKKVLKDTIKSYRKLTASNGHPEQSEGSPPVNKDELHKELSKVYKTLDKMAKVNIIKAGKADRLKSRLSKKLAA